MSVVSAAVQRAKRKRLAKRAATCVHFTGLASPTEPDTKTCAAGVCYRAHVGGPDYGWARRIPCTPKWEPDDEVVECELFEARGLEAAEEEQRQWDKRFDDSNRARRAISAHLKLDPPTRDSGGFIDCPVCGGAKSLAWSWAKLNGHVWGRCSTEDCVSWME
jgi:hypothetical protein